MVNIITLRQRLRKACHRQERKATTSTTDGNHAKIARAEETITTNGNHAKVARTEKTITTNGDHAKIARTRRTTSVETHEAAWEEAMETTTRDLSTAARDHTGRVQKVTLGRTMTDSNGYVKETRRREIRMTATKANEGRPRSNPAKSGTVAGAALETAIKVETTEATVATGENGTPVKSIGAAAMAEIRKRRSKARDLVQKVLHPSRATRKRKKKQKASK